MKMKRLTVLCTLFVFLVSIGFAVNVTVNSTQPEVAGSNYQTIGAALTYVKSQAEPRIVRITGGGPYSESAGIEIDYSLTMYGDGYKPLIICGPTATAGVAASNLSNGIYIFILDTAPADTHIDVVLKNFIVIPDKTNTPTNHGIRCNTDSTALSATATMSVYLEDVVVTANDGADNPVTTDGFTPDTAPAGIKRFGNRGIYLSGHLNDLETTGIISSWNSVDGCVYTPDDYAGRTLYKTIHIGPGCVFSYNGRNGLYFYSDGTPVNMNGTASKPIWVYKNRVPDVWTNWQGALGVWNDDNGRPECVHNWKYVYVVGNNETGIHTGYTDNLQSLPELHAEHCFICNNSGAGIYISDELAGGGTPAGLSEFLRNWTFTNCTISNNGLAPEAAPRVITGPLSITSGAFASPPTGVMTFDDCILGGKGSAASAGDNTISVQKSNFPALVFNYCGIVLAGSQALSGFNLVGGSPSPVLNQVIYEDPIFVDPTTITSPNFYGVDSSNYGGKGSAGSNLSGAGPYLGSVTFLGVNSPWQLYE
jgi:hypothetical protein